MDPATITLWAGAIAALARLVQNEIRWHRSQERAVKRKRKKLAAAAKRGPFEVK